MPKQVYLEEAIEHVSTFCQHHLETIIYPEFDPIYKAADVKGMIDTLYLLFWNLGGLLKKQKMSLDSFP